MHSVPQISICAVDETVSFRGRGITHLVSISNPGVTPRIPAWFSGDSLSLQFGDVVSEADAARCRTTAPTVTDVTQAIEFARTASRLLVFCDYGASRSPALAYVMLSSLHGPGHEQECFDKILEIRPEALPNTLVIGIGDEVLQRSGALLAPMCRHSNQVMSDLGLNSNTPSTS